MINLKHEGYFFVDGKPSQTYSGSFDKEKCKTRTIAYNIMQAHSVGEKPSKLKIKFDSLISHDITYVGIIQTARASGLEKFPVPYVLTNCHNSLCAVGGTINEDDHAFGLSAAKKYGGDYVPANMAVIHQYAREMQTACGRMILGSDSHTRYGAMGTMGVGEGGPEIVKQLLSNTYDLRMPEVVMVHLTGAPKHGVGPQDVAIALCGAVYDNGFVKNKVLEFVGDGIKNLSMDFRIGIDVMTTETTCLSSIWQTDETVKEFYYAHGRPEAYRELMPEDGAYYDSLIEIDLSSIEPMAALPFHPSKAYTIRELQENGADIFASVERELNKNAKVKLSLMDKIKDGKIMIDQGIIAGCSGGMYENIAEAAAILDGESVGNGYFSLSVYPSSVPLNMELIRNGVQAKLMLSGALFKPCFCGPCFGAGDVPANNTLSIRHTTRNFPSREGSKPSDGQISGVMLMDARSIAATARNKGVLSSAADIDYVSPEKCDYKFDKSVYDKRVYFGFDKAEETELKMGPNIKDWPKIEALSENMLIKICSVLHDEVTTTDELIPSGETSSYRSNPLKLAEFTLSRRDPMYVERAKALEAIRDEYKGGKKVKEIADIFEKLGLSEEEIKNTSISSTIFAKRPGDGSAREQAASCQRVLGAGANICYEFATKRYRSNCINWGMLPFTMDKEAEFPYQNGDYVFVSGIKSALENGLDTVTAKVITKDGIDDLTLSFKGMTDNEKQILLDGCLMNYYANLEK